MHKIAHMDILVMHIVGPPEKVQPDLWDGGIDTLLRADLYSDPERCIYPHVDILRPVANYGRMQRRLSGNDVSILGVFSYDEVIACDPAPLAARMREVFPYFMESFVIDRARHFMTRLRNYRVTANSEEWYEHTEEWGGRAGASAPAEVWYSIVRDFAAQLPRPMTEHRPMTSEETEALAALEALEASGDE